MVREKNKQLGRIPNVSHTDHANLARLESIELSRVDPKHFRWYQEINQGGSLLLHRPGGSTLHKGPDGLSRNVEGRDHLILARSSEWEGYRERIRGIADAITSGEDEDEEPEALTVDRVPQEQLEPMPHAQGLATSLRYERKNQETRQGKGASAGSAAPASQVVQGGSSAQKAKAQATNAKAVVKAASKGTGKGARRQPPRPLRIRTIRR